MVRLASRFKSRAAGVVKLALTVLVASAPGLPAQQTDPAVPVSGRIMHWTPEQLRAIIAEHLAAPQFSATGAGSLPKDLPISTNLYPLLSCVPSDRDQGNCGDCWAWGCTGTMEIALNVQNGIRDRLSVQFLNSCDPFMNPCGGGGFSDFCRFYNHEGFAIPWSNSGAAYCGGGGNPTCIACSNIFTNPRYPLTNLSYYAISTGSDEAASVANIKAALNQGKGLYFFFYLPTTAAWNDFDNFYFRQGQNVVWTNFYCGVTSDSGSGGHVVLCLGYYDDGTANRYWIMLNSWGPTSQRQTNTFYVGMNMDYTCAGTWNFGFQAINVSFLLAPIILQQPVSQSACQGSTAKLTIVTAPGTPLTYQWSKNGSHLGNGGNVSGAGTSALSLSNLSTNDEGTYSVALNYGNGSVTSAPALLTVPVPAGIGVSPQSQSVCQGGNVTLTVTATGTAPAYQWQFNGTNLPARLSTYSLINAHTNKTGSYTVVVSNACNVVTSSVACLTVSVPPAIAVQPRSLIVTQGGTAAFTVTSAASPAPDYQWQLNGINVSSTLSAYSVRNVHTNKAGPYTVILSNACNALTSSVAWLTVLAPLPSQTATQGAPVALNVPYYGNDPSLVWQWQKNGANLADNAHISGSASPSLSLSSVAPADAGSYFALASNSAGSAASLATVLSVIPPPPPYFSAISRGADGSLQLSMSGEAGVSYVLESSSNWLDWSDLCTLCAPDGCLGFNDSSATNGMTLFYRLRVAP